MYLSGMKCNMNVYIECEYALVPSFLIQNSEEKDHF